MKYGPLSEYVSSPIAVEKYEPWDAEGRNLMDEIVEQRSKRFLFQRISNINQHEKATSI